MPIWWDAEPNKCYDIGNNMEFLKRRSILITIFALCTTGICQDKLHFVMYTIPRELLTMDKESALDHGVCTKGVLQGFILIPRISFLLSTHTLSWYKIYCQKFLLTNCQGSFFFNLPFVVLFYIATKGVQEIMVLVTYI